MKLLVKETKPRKSDLDVFLAGKLKGANFNTGFYQVPHICRVDVQRPRNLVLWSNRKQCQDKANCALIFYEYDCRFDGPNGIYNILKYGSDHKVKQLIGELKNYAFVVCPDYSVYGDFPNYRQIEAIAKSREVGCVLASYGVNVVVNFRATFEWTYEIALSGIEPQSTIAVGTLGALRDCETRRLLKQSIDALVWTVQPKNLLVYGAAPSDVFESAIKRNVVIWQFDSDIKKAFSKENS